ncbi:MAG: efflux RND transporter periplasmic adaptor subunit [candidate division WOR-3 bacterium]|nr:MAG: efflux RND transporter periplasmic adaptor subunit [candidate division WOR-3 bacterium]
MKKKTFIVIGAAILVIVIVVLNVTQKESGKEVEVTIVKKGNITSKVTASGELRAKSQVDISAETIGRIKKIYFKEGDYVKKDNLVIELDDVNADANRRLAEARLHQAEQDFKRGTQLFEKELISQENFEKIHLAYETAKAQYDQAKDAYRKTKIYAPISGKILKINVEEGETAVMGTMNYLGTVLMTIADLSSMIAVVKIDETDVPGVMIDQPADIVADALPDSNYPGRITKIGLMPIMSQLSTETVTDFEVEIEMAEFSPLLRPGMNVKADIITSKKSEVLTIPIQAVGKRKINDKTTETIFIVQDKKAHLREVAVGVSSDTDTEILSGIAEGDTVIIGPYRILSTLKDDQQVTFKISEEDTSSSGQTAGPRRLFRNVSRKLRS